MDKAKSKSGWKYFEKFSDKIGAREDRRKRAEQRGRISIWVGLGMFGRIGWAIVIPGLIGVTFGAWLDSQFPGSPSWALMLLGAGIGIGCFNAWEWVSAEHELIKKDTSLRGENLHE